MESRTLERLYQYGLVTLILPYLSSPILGQYTIQQDRVVIGSIPREPTDRLGGSILINRLDQTTITAKPCASPNAYERKSRTLQETVKEEVGVHLLPVPQWSTGRLYIRPKRHSATARESFRPDPFPFING
jgi:hypothetical protein